jgi:glycosyltransferase involved in cell wall biosynthesis
VVTHHGPDYDRDKWGGFARFVLRTGERMGMRYSHARIVISKVIQALVESKYARDSTLIPNGVLVAEPRVRNQSRRALRPGAGRYCLQVSRIVPEKRQLDLIRAFALAKPTGWKLALVGGLGGTTIFQRGRRCCKEDRQRSPHGVLERRAARTTLLTRRPIRFCPLLTRAWRSQRSKR